MKCESKNDAAEFVWIHFRTITHTHSTHKYINFGRVIAIKRAILVNWLWYSQFMCAMCMDK